MTVTVGAVRERLDGERRVALTPGACERLAATGVAVRLERGAGLAAGFLDGAYEAAGAVVADDVAGSNVVACVHPPEPLDGLAAGSLLVGLLAPLSRPPLATDLAARTIDSLALARPPHHPRAGHGCPVVAGHVAGYRAVLVAAERLPRFFPLLTTAAGTVRPARLLVLGAGVAGLQAIATGRRLGAVVSAFDVRQAAREQVESLGATFLAIELDEDAEGEGGYAKELSEEAHRREQELVARHVAESDVVITTALVPGRPAPSPGHRRDGRRHAPGLGHRGPGGRGRRQLRAHRARRDGRCARASRSPAAGLPAAGTPQDAKRARRPQRHRAPGPRHPGRPRDPRPRGARSSPAAA